MTATLQTVMLATIMNDLPAVVVLAAGAGTRFEGPGHKLAQRVTLSSDGKTILGACLANATATGLRVVVVATEALAAQASEQIAARDVVIVPSAAPERGRGMGDSIAAGVAACGEANGWLILPGDMPCVLPETILTVAQAMHGHSVVFAQYRARRGHPVGFAAGLYNDLIQLTGDEGARRLIARYPAQAVDVPDAGVLMDIDTLDDLEALRGDDRARPYAMHDTEF
jgi:molybdenum cofactor cytidylyltransferase